MQRSQNYLMEGRRELKRKEGIQIERKRRRMVNTHFAFLKA